MAYTLEQATDLINQLTTQVAQLLTRAATADDEPRQMHAELMKHQGQLTQANMEESQNSDWSIPKPWHLINWDPANTLYHRDGGNGLTTPEPMWKISARTWPAQ